MPYTKETSHITQLDSPIHEANEGELCDQFDVVEKFWTPTHGHSYATVYADHTEGPANKHPAGSYLYLQ